jgi:hypothetical protein
LFIIFHVNAAPVETADGHLLGAWHLAEVEAGLREAKLRMIDRLRVAAGGLSEDDADRRLLEACVDDLLATLL